MYHGYRLSVWFNEREKWQIIGDVSNKMISFYSEFGRFFKKFSDFGAELFGIWIACKHDMFDIILDVILEDL